MTGSEIKRQVMEALERLCYYGPNREEMVYNPALDSEALSALAPCTVLTPEEREMLRVLVQEAEDGLGGNPPNQAAALAFLSPDPEIFAPRDQHTYVTHEPPSSGAGATKSSQTTEASPPAPDDIGPPAPGEGDDLPNPEIGMEC